MEPSHFKTLPKAGPERLHLSSSSVVPAPGPRTVRTASPGYQYASRMLEGPVKRRPSHPTKIDKYLVHHCPPSDLICGPPSPVHSGAQRCPPPMLDPWRCHPRTWPSQLTLLTFPCSETSCQKSSQSCCAWNKEQASKWLPILWHLLGVQFVSFGTVQEILRHEDSIPH